MLLYTFGEVQKIICLGVRLSHLTAITFLRGLTPLEAYLDVATLGGGAQPSARSFALLGQLLIELLL